MAAWQVDFHLVPRRSVTARSNLASTALADTDWWANAASIRLPSPLGGSRRAMPSSSPELEMWGPEDGNRVNVWSEGGHVRSVMVRVDVRRLDSKFGAALLNFVRAAGAVLIRRDGFIVEPTIGAYAAALRSSDAWRFASDPAAFFASQLTSDNEDLQA
jgi:hypothetical protein